jgi:hypothetical protein
MAALNEFATKYRNQFSKIGISTETPIKFDFTDGRSLIMPVNRFLKICHEGIEVLCRQGFIMLYGSLETYFFELLEKSFQRIGVNQNILDRSINIMMTKQWDGKLCKMRDTFSIEYRCSDLMNKFKSFSMQIDETKYLKPLIFLDQLVYIRHRIIHASSIMEKGTLLFININRLREFYAFCALLTEYIDKIFSKKFGYSQTMINPAEA